MRRSKLARLSQGLLVVALFTFTTVIVSAGLSLADSGNEWTVYGGDYANTRYSTLDQINKDNVKNLKVAWMHSLGSTHSQENTPLVIGGKMYIATSAGPAFVFALDAKTGEMLWSHEPEMPDDYHSICVLRACQSRPCLRQWQAFHGPS